MKAEELDKKFDDNENIDECIDYSTVTRPNWKSHRLNFDLPEWVVKKLDFESKRSGIPRNSLIKKWLVEAVEKNIVNKMRNSSQTI